MRPAVAYRRRSTDDQPQSLVLQKQAIEAAAKEKSYGIQEWFTDDGVSGLIPMDRRPAGAKLLDYVRAHPEVTAVFFDDISRMGRSRDLHAYSARIHWFHEHGVVAFFLGDNQRSDSPHFSDFLITIIKGLESTEYSKKLSWKVSRAQIALVQRGFLSGRQPPFGFDRLVVTDAGEPLYRVVKTPGNELVKYNTAGNEIEKIPPIKKTNHQGQDILVAQPIPKARTQHVILAPSLDPLKVGTVRRIFETYDQNGVGLRYISNLLNQKGYPSPYGKAWRTSTVREILKNPAYYGAIVFNRRCMSVFHRLTRTPADGEAAWKAEAKGPLEKASVSKNPEDEWVKGDARAEFGIIDQGLFDRVQKKLQARSTNCKGRTNESRYLLSGLVYCGQCSRKMYGTPNTTYKHKIDGNGVATKQVFTYHKYTCSTYMTQGTDQCGHNTAHGEQLDTFMLGRLKARFLKLLTLHKEAAIRTLARMLKPRDQQQEVRDVKALAARVEELNQKVDLALESISAENRGEINRKITQWRLEKERLLGEIKRAKEGPKREPHSAKSTAERAFDLLNELVDVLRNADPRKQKEFIRRCVQKVVLDFVRVPQGRRHVNQLVGGHISYYQLGDTLALGELWGNGGRGDWI